MRTNRSLIVLSVAAFALMGSAAAAAASAEAIANFNGVTVRTSDEVTFRFTGVEALEARGETTNGVDDPANDGTTFDAAFTGISSGEAFNNGISGATSFASTSDTSQSGALTLLDAEVLMGGRGLVQLDIAYSLFAEVFGNPNGFATAGIEASIFGESDRFVLDFIEDGGDLIDGVLSLSFMLDFDPQQGEVFDSLRIVTFANATSVVAAPAPSLAWLLFLGWSLLLARRALPRELARELRGQLPSRLLKNVNNVVKSNLATLPPTASQSN